MPRHRRMQRDRTLSATLLLLLASGSIRAAVSDEWVEQVAHANALVERGRMAEAREAYAAALAGAERDKDELRRGIILQNLGGLLYLEGKLLEAEKTFLRALSAFKRVPDCDPRHVLRVYTGIAAAYIETGQFSKAEAVLRTALGAYPNPAPAEAASLTGMLGVVLMHRGQLEESEQLLRGTAASGLSSRDAELWEIGAIATANLARLSRRAGRFREAVSLYEQALAVMDALPRRWPTTFAETLAGHAEALRAIGEHNRAEDSYRRAIRTVESGLGPTHPRVARLLRDYAGFLRESGRRSEARTVEREARRIAIQSARENLSGHTIAIEALRERK